MKLAFIGCGAAGRPMAIAWREAGHELGAIVCRTPATSAEAARAIGGGTPGGDPRDADVVVFATPDDSIASAAAAHALRADQVALHLSGAHPSTLLAPTGARVASLHPLCAFASATAEIRLSETHFFVEGGAGAVEVAEQLARDVGPHVARIQTANKLLYHAGAAIASNYVVTLLAIARELFGDAGVEPEPALAALTQLARGAVDNVGRVGLPAALTGPAARGDVELVSAHLDVLGGELRALYQHLLTATLPLAYAKGGAGAEALKAMRALVERPMR